jgi:elongation factor P
MKISGNEIRPGDVIEHNGALWLAVKTQSVKPGKGGAYNQVELKNLKDGTKLNERFRAAETVERADLEWRDYQFLYESGDMLAFMDLASYEQIELAKDFLGEERVPFLQDGMKVRVNTYQGNPISISLPLQVVLEVAECEPTLKGQTAASSYKPALLSNGVRTMVPPFITPGEKIIVATEDASYVRRAE